MSFRGRLPERTSQTTQALAATRSLTTFDEPPGCIVTP